MNDKIVSGKQKLIKDLNRNIVIKLIIKRGSIGRAELAKMTGLSLPSVMRITEALLEEGLLEEAGQGSSSGGRKPNLLSLKRDAFYIIGVEIALSTTVVLSDLSGSIIDRWETDEALRVYPEELLERISQAIWDMLKKNNISREKLAGIGIGTPGMNFKHVVDMELAIIKGWETIDAKAWFETRAGFEGILIITENVARTRTLNELWFGKGRDLSSFMYIFVDNGVGCCLVNNGILYTGSTTVAGEFGHTTIEPNGRPCYCGNKGCIEMYVSAGAITRTVKQRLGIKDTAFSFSDVLDMGNNPVVMAVFEESGSLLGMGIANLINLFNPKAVILGGEAVQGNKRYSDTAVKSAYEKIFSMNAQETPVYISGIGKTHHCLGSVALVINDLFKSIEI